MLKSERHHFILALVNEKGTISVTDLEKQLQVSTMTIRRDLDGLDKQGLLIRTHGGATSNDFYSNNPLTYDENREIHLAEKKAVAKAAANKIVSGDIIFMGPGTTIELMIDYITTSNIQIVTSSYTVFKRIIESSKDLEVILVGGKFEKKANCFSGTLSTEMVSKLHFSKSFIGINGINGLSVTTFNIDSGNLQNVAMQNSDHRFIVADKYKFAKQALFDFYTIQPEDICITNSSLSSNTKKEYEKSISFEFADG